MRRREFLGGASSTLFLLGASGLLRSSNADTRDRPAEADSIPGSAEDSRLITLFLCGDVMTGRGIDQVLPHPGDPRIHEPTLGSAVAYVRLAEEASGTIPRPVGFDYVWGDALRELDRVTPDVRVVNLETSVTTSDAHWPDKVIHYRMHPDNTPCITAAGIDCCVLANNHVLDWGHSGLEETLEVLQGAGVRTAGAGRDAREAQAPAVLEVPEKGRVIVCSLGAESSGIPRSWAASANRPGVHLLRDLSPRAAREVAKQVASVRRTGDVVVASIHWGSNWGYRVPREQREFARRLIDEAGAHVVHGHSSHHPRGIEVYANRPILYGCGDFVNDYEGIGGYEEYRPDLALMYFVTLDPTTGELARFEMTPIRIRRFKLNRGTGADAQWLRDTLNRESSGVRVVLEQDDTLHLRWDRISEAAT
jgi:poly-gamma-glutamate synthesis protein (capsule biosynthesis protein)